MTGAGEARLSKQKATLRTIASELGIAPSTVLRALSGKPNVRPALREKIAACAAANGYVLPNHTTGNVAVITAEVGIFNYLSCLLAALSNELHKDGFRVCILSEKDADVLNDYLYDGVISTTWSGVLERKFAEIHALPFVSLNGINNRRDNIFSVCSDDFGGITRGLQYLYDAGARRIAFIVSSQAEGNRGSAERISAFRQFCAKHNLPVEDFCLCKEGSSFEELVAKVVELKADAIFYVNEGHILELYHELRKRSIRIPEDISVIGLEAWSISCFLDPPLTSLRQDFEGLARESVAMLKKLIAGKKVNADVRLPYTLIERASVRRRAKPAGEK